MIKPYTNYSGNQGCWYLDFQEFAILEKNLPFCQIFMIFGPYTPQGVPDRTCRPRNEVSGWFLMILIAGWSLSSLWRPRTIDFPPDPSQIRPQPDRNYIEIYLGDSVGIWWVVRPKISPHISGMKTDTKKVKQPLFLSIYLLYNLRIRRANSAWSRRL